LASSNPSPSGHGENVEGFDHCPRCAARLEKRRLKTGEPERLVCVSCDFVMFLDPKVAAGCIAEMEGGIILVRRSIEPGYGKWVFPGGYVDRGEKVEAAAAREMLEESGIEVSIDTLLGVYSYTNRPIVVIVYTATVTGGALVAADESLDARRFEPREIPWKELAFPSTFDALSDYLQRHHAMQPPTHDGPPHP
jgi:ADP-ribose pyrophosphatase YjhB (NUDIX family)